MPYHVPLFRSFLAAGCELHVMRWTRRNITPYQLPWSLPVATYDRESFSTRAIMDLARALRPDIAYIAGWQDLGYLPAAMALRRSGTPVVVGFDDQWLGKWRQRAGALLSRFILRPLFFSHAWVAGPRQYAFAQRLGFRDDEIIFHLLSADTRLFGTVPERRLSSATTGFLYVGALRRVKGVDVLLDAYDIYRKDLGGAWTLTCVGSGELAERVARCPDVQHIGFSDQDELAGLAERAGAFILPSRLDQWGVVVHEFASAGLPLILSEGVGAAPQLLIPGYNGFRVRNADPADLALAMRRMELGSEEERRAMGKRSTELAMAINPEMSAQSFLSLAGRASAPVSRRAHS